MSRTPQDHLHDALDHLEILARHMAAGDLDDQTVSDAVCLRLGAAIESVSKVPADVREPVLGDRWRAIWATRNRIAHLYVLVDRQIIEQTVDQDVPAFRDAIITMLESLD
ncbi:MAG: DUF86 domain-containing protein [Nocardioidaceae bacterium]|nr:DUF86 domain-containing protein [Nocardioidaceae bacterium]